MTCRHVLGLIDAGPSADYPRAHLDAAWQHARACPTCGPALKASRALAVDLSALAQPAPPVDLAPAVLARVRQIRRAAAAEGETVVRRRDWTMWIAPAGGFAATLAIALSIPSGARAPLDVPLATLSATFAGVDLVPSTSGALFVFAAGLGIYVAGLLAPLARTRAEPPASRRR